MATEADHPPDVGPLRCARCLIELQPGTGNFYRISIEAVADPFPPIISAEDLEADLRQQIEQFLARMQTLSEQEALDQIYRQLTLYLCGPCYQQWIKNPTG